MIQEQVVASHAVEMVTEIYTIKEILLGKIEICENFMEDADPHVKLISSVRKDAFEEIYDLLEEIDL